MLAQANVVNTVSYEAAMTRLKKLVFKNRIRLRDFMQDFDRLRKGEMLPSQFTRGMAIAGVDKWLTPAEIEVICQHYTAPKTASMDVMHYAQFLADVDEIFTKPELEKHPLEVVPAEPSELLDRDRYQRSSRDLGPEKEARLAALIGRIGEICGKRGVMIKPFFDDAATDDHSATLYGHVTHAQFKQCLSVKVNIHITPDEANLLCEKFRHDDYPELTNYVAFSHTVDPPLGRFETYV